VLCTPDRTYDVKEAETSNSLLVVPSLKLPDNLTKDAQDKEERSVVPMSVAGVFHRYLELRPCKPRLGRLRQELDHMASLTQRSDLADEELGLTEAHLLDKVQSSKIELTEGLHLIQACQVNDKWYILDTDYRMKIISHILKFAEENSWALSEGCVDREDTVRELGELEPSELVSQVFDQYFVKGSNSVGYEVNWTRLSRFFGEYLLKRADTFRKAEFDATWRHSLPEEAPEPPLEALDGLCFVEDDVIRYFPEHTLPEVLLERFQVLFQAKPRWTLNEISPFVAPLTSGKLDVKALLTKYARGINEGNIKYFCAKHGK